MKKCVRNLHTCAVSKPFSGYRNRHMYKHKTWNMIIYTERNSIYERYLWSVIIL